MELDWDLVVRKVGDYKEDVNEIEVKFERARKKVQENGLSILSNEMDRFLPKQILESYKPIYNDILRSVIELISDLEGPMESDHIEGQ